MRHLAIIIRYKLLWQDIPRDKMPYNILSLFSGGLAGLCERGIAIAGVQDKFKVRQFVEYVPYRQHLLRQNFPGIAIWDDIRTYSNTPGSFDIICGGSPCTDNSLANPKRNGLHGDRSGLWWEMHRLISEIKPRVVLWENPDGCRHPTKDDAVSPLGYVLWSLNEIGYSAQWQTISAADVGAPHKRDRVFVVAYPNNDVKIKGRVLQSPWSRQIGESIAILKDYRSGAGNNESLQGMDDGSTTGLDTITRSGWWEANPFTGEMAAKPRSVSDRAERVAILGDGCTPQQSAVCWQYINYLLG